MAKDINTPVNITIEPRIRAIIERNHDNPDEPLEVADIQMVIKAVSRYVNILKRELIVKQDKIERQKDTLNRYASVIEKQKDLLEENGINCNIDVE